MGGHQGDFSAEYSQYCRGTGGTCVLSGGEKWRKTLFLRPAHCWIPVRMDSSGETINLKFIHQINAWARSCKKILLFIREICKIRWVPDTMKCFDSDPNRSFLYPLLMAKPDIRWIWINLLEQAAQETWSYLSMDRYVAQNIYLLLSKGKVGTSIVDTPLELNGYFVMFFIESW